MTDDRTDDLLTVFAQQHESVEALMESFFGFLHRRSDLYVVTKDPKSRGMGFCPGQAEQLVLKAFRKYSTVNADAAEPERKVSTKDTAAGAPRAPRTQVEETAAAASSKASVPERPRVTTTADGKQVPVENGGVTDRYVWTQTLEDVTLQVGLPVGTHAKDIECKILSKHLYVALRPKTAAAPSVLMDDDLPYRVRTDECLWSIENGHTLSISLEKMEPTWWACALQGDIEIDTSAVDSTRALHTYDPAVQGAVQKAVFDMRQQQQGLPTSEELKMQELLAKAKLAPNSPL